MSGSFSREPLLTQAVHCRSLSGPLPGSLRGRLHSGLERRPPLEQERRRAFLWRVKVAQMSPPGPTRPGPPARLSPPHPARPHLPRTHVSPPPSPRTHVHPPAGPRPPLPTCTPPPRAPTCTHPPERPRPQRLGSLAAHVLLWEPPLSKGPPSRQSCSMWEFKGQTPRLPVGPLCRASPISQLLARQLRTLQQLFVTQSLPLPHAAFLSPHRWSQGHSSIKLVVGKLSQSLFPGEADLRHSSPQREKKCLDSRV